MSGSGTIKKQRSKAPRLPTPPTRQGSTDRPSTLPPPSARNENDNETISGRTSSTYYSDGELPASGHLPPGQQQQVGLPGGKAPRRSSGTNSMSSIGRRSRIRAGGIVNKKLSPHKVVLRQNLKLTPSSDVPSLPSKPAKKTRSIGPFGLFRSSSSPFRLFGPPSPKGDNNIDDTSAASDVSELSNPTLTFGGVAYYKNRPTFWIPVVLLSCIIFAVLAGDFSGFGANDRFMMEEHLKQDKYSIHAPPPQQEEQNYLHQSLRRQEELHSSPKGTVGYVLPIFNCHTPDNTYHPRHVHTFHNAALMLKASIHRQSYKNPHSGSAYDYEMIAIIHPSVIKCSKDGPNRADVLRDLGYKVQAHEEPVKLDGIQGEYLKTNAPLDGPGGIKDLIRLYAYKLTNYDVVTLVDFTTLVLQPPDDMFNLIVDGGNHAPAHMSHQEGISTNPRLPSRVDVVYTRDYTTVTPKQWTTGMNLSFLPIRPSMDAFNELVDIYTKGDYDSELGWGGDHEYGVFQGSMLTTGLLTYYHTYVHPSSHVELYRCKYVNMADAPRLKLDDDTLHCRDRRETDVGSCTDCRITSMDDVVIADMGECGAPWACQPDDYFLELCKAFHSSWFGLRKEVEDILLVDDRSGGPIEPLYCAEGSYVPLLLPSHPDDVEEVY